MAWKTAILCYTDKKHGKTVARSYTGVSASGSLSDACKYVARPEESLCFAHMHAEVGGELKRIPMRDEDQSYLATVQRRWQNIVDSETGAGERDWIGTGRAQKNSVSAYGYIIPLPNDVFYSDPTQTRSKIETLLKSIYGDETSDLTYALHRGNARYSEHEQNLHLHVLIRPRGLDGKKWQRGTSELLQWNVEKRERLGEVLQSWGYEIEHTPVGKGQKRFTREEHAVFLEKEGAVVSEAVRSFGTALKMKNEGSRLSRWSAASALRWSAYQSAMNDVTWTDALKEQGWIFVRSDGDRRTWQIKDIQTGRTFALRRLFSCKEQEVEDYVREMQTAIESTKAELSRIRRERPGAIERARQHGPNFSQALGSGIGTAIAREPAGALMMLMACPGIGLIIAALFIALKAMESNIAFNERELKSSLTASWKEEKDLRLSLCGRLTELAQQQKSRPVSEYAQSDQAQLSAEVQAMMEGPRTQQPQHRKQRLTEMPAESSEETIARHEARAKAETAEETIARHEARAKAETAEYEKISADRYTVVMAEWKRVLNTLHYGGTEGADAEYDATVALLERGYTKHEIRGAFLKLPSFYEGKVPSGVDGVFTAINTGRLKPTIRSAQPQSLPASARPSAKTEQPRIFGAGQASLTQAIRSGDLRTAGKLDKNADGIADSAQDVDSDGDGVSDAVEHKEGLNAFHVKQEQHGETIVEQWNDMKKTALEKGKKDSGILNYSTTEKLLKKYSITEIKTAFKSSGEPIPSGVLRCLADTKNALEDSFGEAEAYR